MANEASVVDGDLSMDASGVIIANDVHGPELSALVQEKEKMQVEFNVQRARMKDLFLQKEDELESLKTEKGAMTKEFEKVTHEVNELKSQLLVAGLQLENNVESEKRRAAEEIASLQQLVQETVEESSMLKSEVQRLSAIIQSLELQLQDVKQQSPHQSKQENAYVAPSLVLSAVTKKIGKKFGADFFASQDEDHREDHELLKTLIGPLEEEIKALKDKLRATDEELQRCKVPDAAGSDAKACDMCRNYEDGLVVEQKRVTTLEAKVLAAEKSAERHKEDLLKEIGFRKDMEEKWNEKKEEHKVLVGELSLRLGCAEQDLKEVQDSCDRAYGELRDRLNVFTADRQQVQAELERLQAENDHLVGKYAMHSQVLQNEIIDLPNTVEELHESVLRMQEELISAKIGKEAAEEQRDTLRGEIILLNDQVAADRSKIHEMKNSFGQQVEQLKKQRDQLDAERKGYLLSVETLKCAESDALAKVREKHAVLEETMKMKDTLETRNKDLRSRISSLQNELDNSEIVQKDFVCLTQHLQVQLEKIRGVDTEVRWQHEEDVNDCTACHSEFTSSRRKEHCRHCGQIFCAACLTHEVCSGPNQRASRVCAVCHTMLVKTSAPYFSTEAPHSPG